MRAGLAARTVARRAGISHTHLLAIERGQAPHADIGALARIAAVLGMDLAVRAYPVGAPVRDAAHVALLARFRSRLHASWTYRGEVPMPIEGDHRSADGTIGSAAVTIMVEAETRLDDVQALEREIAGKQRDLRCDRVVLLVLDSAHNRAVVREVPWFRERFPVGTRAALSALGRGVDPGGDCLVFL